MVGNEDLTSIDANGNGESLGTHEAGIDYNINEAASEDSGMSSVDNQNMTESLLNAGNGNHDDQHHGHHHSDHGHPGLLVMPTSPLSVTTASMSASDDMIENENEMLRERVCALEKKVYDQNDEITCLRATLADCLRRINGLELNKGHVQINSVSNMQKPRLRTRDSSDNITKTPGRHRPTSASYSPQDFSTPGHVSTRVSHESVTRRASYASNRDKQSQMYTSSSSLHTDTSNSMSPAPSPTTHVTSRVQDTRVHMNRPVSAVSLHKKWSSTSDFRDVSPGPGAMSSVTSRHRQTPSGSLASLRSPWGSQQNLSMIRSSSSQIGSKHGTKECQYSPDEGILRVFIRGRQINLICPTSQLDTYSMAKVTPAPATKLKLEWVYGYRGRDARANLHLLPTGEMAYFVAAVVVLYNVEDQSQRHYLGHTQDIRCMSVHPNKLLIATGQAAGADRAHIRVWNSVSLQTLHTIGAQDFEYVSICCLSFSKADGGNLMTAVDDEHNISVWDWSRGHKLTETKCSAETVVSAEFHPLEPRTIVAVGKGFVNFWQLDQTSLTLSRKTGIFDQRDKPKYVTCLSFASNGDVITGDSNGNVFIWGRGYNAVTKVIRKVHDGPIFSICVLKDGSIITGGGRDSRIVKFDTLYRKTGMEAQLPEHLGSIRTVSQGKGSQLLVGTTKNSILTGNFDLNFQEIMIGHVGDVTSLAPSPLSHQFITAGHDRMLHMWDTLSRTVVWSSDVGEHAQSACFSPDGEVIIVGTVTGKWVVLNAATREVFSVNQESGGGEPVYSCKFSPDGKLLALGSRDNAIYIYQVKDNYKKFVRQGRCLGHSSPVVQLDWSDDSVHIQSNSMEFEHMVWHAPTSRPVRDVDTIRDLTWASSDCVVQWSTLGSWGETADTADPTSCAVANCHELLATGDNRGKVRLSSHPSCQPRTLAHVYSGHSQQISRLSWSLDGNKLISIGGKDSAVLQWTLT